MILLSWVNPDSYALQLVVLVVGCAILGLGVSMEVIANVVMLSGEAFVQAISLKKKKEFGMVKIFFDSSLMVAAVIVSLLLYGEVMGVREGTIVAAVIVGMFAHYFNRRLAFVNRYLTADTPAGSETEAVPADNGHFVITIAREYGSGGREIGKQLAQHFGIPFYDRELIDMAAKSEGLSPDFVESREQNIPSSLLYEMIMQDYSVPLENSLSKDDALFVTQSRIIRKLASERSCIIIGRCADYVLRDFKNCFKVFIHRRLRQQAEARHRGIPRAGRKGSRKAEAHRPRSRQPLPDIHRCHLERRFALRPLPRQQSFRSGRMLQNHWRNYRTELFETKVTMFAIGTPTFRKKRRQDVAQSQWGLSAPSRRLPPSVFHSIL